MKKQLAVAVGALLALGTAVSASLNDYAQPPESAPALELASVQLDSKQSAQIVAMWNTHANSSGSVPLPRPF